MGKKKTFYIETLGCKVNQYESDGIASELLTKGLTRLDGKDGADVCIINTCAVTAKAGMQSRQAIRRLIRENPGARIIVTGCHAQTDPEQIRSIEHIDQIVCHKDKTRIADCISNTAPAVLEFRTPDHKDAQFLRFDNPVSGAMTRAYLKIQDGCNAFCTYCIVPYARGASVSMAVPEVHRHVRELAAKGFKEIILTGIHTGHFGLDLDPPASLAGLVEELDAQGAVDRLRISSIEPNEITPELIELAKAGRILCDHFHIPLQSGDNQVLERMKRPYTAEAFTEVVQRIHEALPHAGIGLDCLIGFPGETDQAFQNTYDLVESLPVSYLHVFPFSPRKGTPAFHFKPKVAGQAVKERCAVMRELGKQKQAAFIRANQGRTLQGLVQHQADQESGWLKAVTSNYLTVMLEPDDGLKGKIVDLVYDRWDDALTIKGQVVAPEA